MGNREGQLHLSLSVQGIGYHPGSWNHPEAGRERLYDPEFYRGLARTAERGRFDLFYLDPIQYYFSSRPAGRESGFLIEPVALLTACIGATDYIGLGTAIETTVTEPYAASRQWAALDHLSGGRMAWQAVTTGYHEPIRQLDFPEWSKADKLERLQEFIAVAERLWDSWEPAALLIDKKQGRFVDADKIHFIHHAGKHFQVRGPLSVPAPPQGHPVSIGTLSGLTGSNLGDVAVDLSFGSPQTLEEATALYNRVKQQQAETGTAALQGKVLANLMPILGTTEQEAKHKAEWLQELAGSYEPPKVAAFIGTPVQLVDWMENWYGAYGSDGFNILPPVLPADLELFVDEVVPLLQRRGLLRVHYTDKTLRGNLGLAIPVNPYEERGVRGEQQQ